MNFLVLLLWTALLAINHDTVKAGNCDQIFPIEFNGLCYAIKTDKLPFDRAVDACNRMDGKMTSIQSKKLLEVIENIIYEFVTENLEIAKFWIGFTMTDYAVRSSKKDRIWEWELGGELVQKDYTLWDEDGGPVKDGLMCAAVDCANEYKVKALDCGGTKLPIICQMKKGKVCKDDALPYLAYGDYCFAVSAGTEKYSAMSPSCNPNAPIKYLEEMKPFLQMAIRNSFLGGGMFMNMQRKDGKFIDLATGKEPEASEWEVGEPRDHYDCVARSLQPNNTLKLKTINCGFAAAFLCISNSKYALYMCMRECVTNVTTD